MRRRIQLALDVQLPEEVGGLGGQAIYIGALPQYPDSAPTCTLRSITVLVPFVANWFVLLTLVPHGNCLSVQ